MDYTHVDVFSVQTSKKTGLPCGDVLATVRTNTGTTVICADGIGSGIRAHIAAQMCVARLTESLRQDISFRKIFASVATTMQNSRDPKKPFAAFSIARIRSDGNATVFSYDAPLPILVSRQGGTILANRPFPLPGGLAMESNCQLEREEGILLMSDGITQAGIGYGANTEWTSEGVVRFINEKIASRMKFSLIPETIHKEALARWQGKVKDKSSTAVPARSTAGRGFSPYTPDAAHQNTIPSVHRVVGDDCSIVLALCRTGQTVNIFTGPPEDREQDLPTIKRFIHLPGLKIVCGGTTAKLVAKYLNVPLEMEPEPMSVIAPPRYAIKGINLVTEGAVTLNQVYNILDEDIARLNEDSGVTELRLLLGVADKLNIIVGCAANTANADISFRQRGVLSRKVLVPLLAEKLRQEGKLVNVEFV
ncbi:MAG: serine/threonine-protein phosphatase [Planctomycetaceae bacterium]|jgi:hypothetical protein|nr:serine/threonine-protein phosphatase [Planctomycetaceae bacterium]